MLGYRHRLSNFFISTETNVENAYQPLVTIGIPTYNRAEQTLPVTLACARGQTYQNLQIVVSDNCSGDGTEDMMRGMADARIDYVRHAENIGANNNFNACVQHARGEYFLLLHDDDVIDDDFVEVCVAALQNNAGVGLVRTGIRMIDGDGDSKLEWENRGAPCGFTALIDSWCNNTTTMFCCNTLINTDALRGIGCFNSDYDLFQDVLAHVKIAAAHGYVNVREVKAGFREHDNNRGAAARIDEWCKDSLQLLDTIVQLAPQADRARLQQQAGVFLCQINYSYIVGEARPWRKLARYRQVSRYFDGIYPAWRYFIHYDTAPRWRQFKQRVKRALGSAPSD